MFLKKGDKKGQMKLSFGMIFSIFLIIIFIAFAFFAIKTFLGLQKHSEIALFLDDLQKDVNDVWQSTNRAKPVSYKVPDSVEEICFRSDSKLVIEPFSAGEGLSPYTLEHFDYEKTTLPEDPLCFQNRNGRISFTIKIEPGDSLVSVEES